MKRPLSDRLEKIIPSVTLGISARLAKLKNEGVKVYSFSIGEPDFKTGEALKEGAIYAVNHTEYSHYTDVKGYEDVRRVIADKLLKDNNVKYSPDEIIMTSGAKAGLFTSLQALLSEGDEAIIPIPYWVSYCEMVKLAEGVPKVIKTDVKNDFKLTAAELKDSIGDKTKLLMLNNPNNPTGAVYTFDELKAITDVCAEAGVYIISDEIYEKFAYDGRRHVSTASVSEKAKEITLTVNGLSKTYAVPGWRLGYVAADKKITDAMSRIQGHCISHPSTISQIAAKYALSADQGFVDDMLREYMRRRSVMAEKLDGIDGISYIKPYGAFYFYINIEKLLGKSFKGEKICDSVKFCEMLLEHKRVAMIPGSGFGTEGYVRAAYTSSYEDILEGLEIFKDFIASLEA